MENTKISPLGTLMSIVNNTSTGTLEYQLASYFLDQYNHFERLNIFDVADQCYCSRASVRRFCKKIGFSNFVEMKKHFINYEFQQRQYTNRVQVDNFRKMTAGKLLSMINDIDQTLDDARLEVVAQKMHQSKNVIIFVVDTAATMAKFFQQEMFFCGKTVKVVTDYSDSLTFGDMRAAQSANHSSIAALGKDDLLITISVTGLFAAATLDIVNYCAAYKMLFTLNRDAELRECYDDVFYISKNEDNPRVFTEYTVYGINYIFDNLFYLYYNRYSGEKKKQ